MIKDNRNGRKDVKQGHKKMKKEDEEGMTR